VSGGTALSAIGSGTAIALFSYLGLAAKAVRDPDRNIPRATVLGTFATAVVYVLSLTAVFGIVPNDKLQSSTAPFSTAVDHMFGGTFWGYVMALVVMTSAIGALNGWTLVTAETPRAAAQDGVFPERFAPAEPARLSGLRRRRLDRARLDRDGHQLTRLRRTDGLHDADPHDRHHGRRPVRVLGARSDEVAHRRPQGDGDAALRPGHDCGRPGRAVPGLLRLLLAEHRAQLLGLLGSVPVDRRRVPARHPGLPDSAQAGDVSP
jgi:hypothetical protein